MLSSLFEIYDPYVFIFSAGLSWLGVFFMLIIYLIGYWALSCSLFRLSYEMLSGLTKEFSSLFSSHKMAKSGLILFVVLFFFLIIINLLGLIPYTFSISSHFVLALSLGFPFWLSLMFLGWLENTNSMFIHLIPTGTPVLLVPLMVFIETVSSLIRPWSLSVRMMANMISGHLLMSLLGECGLGFIFVQVGLFLFEFFVCFIQAYVFSVLLTLYSSEI